MHICVGFWDKFSRVGRARQQLLMVDIFECEPTTKWKIPDELIGRLGLADLYHRWLAEKIGDVLMSCPGIP